MAGTPPWTALLTAELLDDADEEEAYFGFLDHFEATALENEAKEELVSPGGGTSPLLAAATLVGRADAAVFFFFVRDKWKESLAGETRCETSPLREICHISKE